MLVDCLRAFFSLVPPAVQKLFGREFVYILTLNLVFCLAAALRYNVGFDNEEGIELTNSWMVAKGFRIYQDFFDLRGGNILAPLYYGGAFTVWGSELATFRLADKFLGLLGTNGCYWIARSFMPPGLSCVSSILAFAYFNTQQAANHSHYFPTLFSIGATLVFIYGSRLKSYLPCAIGVISGLNLLVEPGIPVACYFLMLLLLFMYKQKGSYIATVMYYHIGIIAIFCVFIGILVLNGYSLAKMWAPYVDRSFRMAETAVVMGGLPLWHPWGLVERHWAHWLGSLYNVLRRDGLTLSTLAYIASVLYYYLLAISLQGFFFVYFVFRAKRSGHFWRLWSYPLEDKVLFSLWFFSIAIWSLEYLRGAPFLNHTPHYTMQFTALLLGSFYLLCNRRFVGQGKRFFQWVGPIVLAMHFGLFFQGVGVRAFFNSLFAEGLSGPVAKSSALVGMRLNENEAAVFDDVAHFVQINSATDDPILVLSFDATYYFLCDRLSPIPECSNIIQFGDSPMPNFDVQGKIAKALEGKSARYIIVQLYSDWTHPTGCSSEPVDPIFPPECLPEVVLRQMNEDARKAFEANYRQVQIFGPTGERHARHVHLLERINSI